MLDNIKQLFDKLDTWILGIVEPSPRQRDPRLTPNKDLLIELNRPDGSLYMTVSRSESNSMLLLGDIGRHKATTALDIKILDNLIAALVKIRGQSPTI